jgi:hypothetical protein
MEAKMGDGTSNPGIPRVAIADGAISPKKLHDALLEGRYFLIKEGAHQPCMVLSGDGDALATGAADSTAQVDFGLGNPRAQLVYLGGAATVLGPRISGSGLVLSLDSAASEGGIYHWGADFGVVGGGSAGGVSPLVYTVGSSPSMFIRAKLIPSTVASVAEMCVGFFASQGLSGDVLPDDFTDAAFVNLIAGDATVETILNDAATESNDTGVDGADGTAIEFRVVLDNKKGAGVPRFFVDGVEYQPLTPFTFDTGDELMPFVHYLLGGVATVTLVELEIGLLEDVDDFLIK